jgi:hypothetical protein
LTLSIGENQHNLGYQAAKAVMVILQDEE